MSQRRLDTWIWVLIFGGLLGASLGWFVQRLAPAVGRTLIVGGGAVAALGVLLIVVRSRMGP